MYISWNQKERKKNPYKTKHLCKIHIYVELNFDSDFDSVSTTNKQGMRRAAGYARLAVMHLLHSEVVTTIAIAIAVAIAIAIAIVNMGDKKETCVLLAIQHLHFTVLDDPTLQT